MQILRVKPPSGGFFSPLTTILPRRKRRKQTKSKGDGSRFTIHPLFFLVGVFYCFTGDFPLFLMSCIVALEHELAHAIAAARLGYRLNKIILMPYGALIDGEIEDLTFKDEITVALWGPLANLLTAFFFASLWWFFPDFYAYTDTACFLSLTIALVNFLPAYPLDGGRVLLATLSLFFLNRKKDKKSAEEKAKRYSKAISAVIAGLLLLLFFLLAKRGEINYSLLLFTLFLAVGIWEKDEGARYGKIGLSNLSKLEHGVEIRRVAVLDSCLVKRLLPYLCRGKYLIIDVYDRNENRLGEIKQSQLCELFTRLGPYAKTGEFFQIFAKNNEKTTNF